ncbi:hypothetical protein [Leifsonia sp. WHRI 6310E]|uniref:hypothetical protein n=1 Tax=Leifsonia sp. WHRI 6310E TaxID=3162562 RepID=UPI0032EA9D71
MTDPDQRPTEDDYVAALLLIYIRHAARHDANATIAAETGLSAKRLREILSGAKYPDAYEITRFELAYGLRLCREELPHDASHETVSAACA